MGDTTCMYIENKSYINILAFTKIERLLLKNVLHTCLVHVTQHYTPFSSIFL